MALLTYHGSGDYYSVGGLRLDGAAWFLDTAPVASTPPVRTSAVQIPGQAGHKYRPGVDVHDPAVVRLSVRVREVDPASGKPAATISGRRKQLETNIQTVLAAFTSGGRAVPYTYTDADGVAWSADAVVVSSPSGTPRPDSLGAVLDFVLELPDPYLRTSSEVASEISSGTSKLTALAGSTAPITDARIFITSAPAGAWISNNQGQTLRLVKAASNFVALCGKMDAVNNGAPALGDLVYSGSNLLTLHPTVDNTGAVSYTVRTNASVTIMARKARFA